MSPRTTRLLGIGWLALLAPLAACGGSGEGGEGGGEHPLPPALSATTTLTPDVIRQIEKAYAEVEDDPGAIALVGSGKSDGGRSGKSGAEGVDRRVAAQSRS